MTDLEKLRRLAHYAGVAAGMHSQAMNWTEAGHAACMADQWLRLMRLEIGLEVLCLYQNEEARI